MTRSLRVLNSRRQLIAVLALCGVLCLPALRVSAQGSCGNGVLDPGEACDDHNLRDDDCCSSSCELIECTILSENPVVWEEMGPFSIGGRVTALAADPNDSQRLLAGTPAGGIWHSTDGGANWLPLAPWLAVTPISALAVDPSDPDIVIAGTGAVSDGGSVSPGTGIIRSNDGGTTWSQVSKRQIVPYIASLLIWEEEPERVLAATDLGVLLSTDRGQNFEYSLEGRALANLVRDPFDADSVFASSRSGLFVSRDRGASWSKLSAWPLLESDTQGAGTTSLVLSHQTPGLLYAVVQVFATFSATDRAMLLKSTDGGTSFEELATPKDFCPNQDSCGYGQSLAIDPQDERRLLLGGDRLLLTADGGESWSELDSATFKVHEIVLHQQGAYAAGASGIALIDSTWSESTISNNGLAITSIRSLDVSDEDPPRFLAGTADEGTLLGVGVDPAWSVIFGAREPAGTARFDPFDDSRLYASRTYGRFFRSDDNGESFTPIQDGLDLPQPAVEVTPFEPSPLVPDTLFAGLMQPFQSTDAGETWLGYRPPGFPEIAEIAVSPVDSDRLYFALSSGGSLFKADDIHTEFLPITEQANHRVTSIFLNGEAENVVYTTLTNTASQSGHIFKSWDFGENWDDITPPGLPAATSIVRDQFGALYVGNAEGVWRSANDGSTWVQFQRGLLGAAVDSLRLSEDRIYAGTTGRGLFSLPLLEFTSIESVPNGQLLWVDDVLVRTPYFALWEPGSVHTVEPYLLQTATSRQLFDSWSNGGALIHDVVAEEGNSALIGAVRNLYRLDFETVPSNGGAIVIEPPTADRFFVENSLVSWVAVPASDHRFVGFSGDLSGFQNTLGYAVMDRPRTVNAEFAPLFVSVDTQPPGLGLSIDGQRVGTPKKYQWSVDSVHQLEAEAMIDLNPADPVKLVFDGWNDLMDRAHEITVRRDNFATNLIARYIQIIPELEVAARSTAMVRTEGERAAVRIAALSLASDDQQLGSSLQIIRGSIDGELTTELGVAPSEPRVEHHGFVAGSSERGTTRLALSNPNPDEAVVDLLLRDASGAGLVLREAALTIPPHGQAVDLLEELVALGDPYEGLLSIYSDQPLVASIQSLRTNLRPTTLLDPILVIPPLAADYGVPARPESQALILTPETEHTLVLANPGSQVLSGSLLFWDEDAGPLELADNASSSPNYEIPAGGYSVLQFRPAAQSAGVIPATARIRVVPTSGQDAPLVQLTEVQTVGQSLTGPIQLPRSIPPSRRCRDFVVPVDLAMRDSGVIISNPELFSAISVNLALLDLDGSELANAEVVVPAESQRLVLVREFFPASDSSFRGSLVGSSEDEIEGVGIVRQINGRGEEILAGFPLPGAGEEASVSETSALFPLAIDGDSWASEWWYFNSSLTASRTIVFSFSGKSGETVHLPMEWK